MDMRKNPSNNSLGNNQELNMSIIDISRPINDGKSSYPDDPPSKFTKIHSMERGDPFDLTLLKISAHTGSHIDAPSHFIDGGLTVDKIPLANLIGRCYLLDLSETINTTGHIPENITIPKNTRRLLIKTGYSGGYWPVISKYIANKLVKTGIVLLGIDTPSFDENSTSNFDIHKSLLSSDIILLEHLNLANTKTGWYQLICLPINLLNTEGAPVRAVLIEN